MSKDSNNYSDLSKNQLLFLMIHHLMQQNYHQSIANFHKQNAMLIQELLNNEKLDK